MKIKVNKHKLNIHYRGSPWGSRTQQHAYCLRYAHSQHIESHLSKKQQQAKIPIAFLFRQLHFNNVTSHSLFHGSHLVMRSKRCAVQNQGIILKGYTIFFYFISAFQYTNLFSFCKSWTCGLHLRLTPAKVSFLILLWNYQAIIFIIISQTSFLWSLNYHLFKLTICLSF